MVLPKVTSLPSLPGSVLTFAFKVCANSPVSGKQGQCNCGLFHQGPSSWISTLTSSSLNYPIYTILCLPQGWLLLLSISMSWWWNLPTDYLFPRVLPTSLPDVPPSNPVSAYWPSDLYWQVMLPHHTQEIVPAEQLTPSLRVIHEDRNSSSRNEQKFHK